MRREPRILFLANWPRTHRDAGAYAFFSHWRSRPRIRFFGTLSLGFWTRWEKNVFHFYLLQPLLALFRAPFYDAVVAFSSQCGLPFALLLRLCFWMRTKLIVLDVESFGRVNGGRRLRLVRFAARRIDHLIYAARGQEAYYDRYLPFLAPRRSFVPIGIGVYEKKLPFDAGREGPIVAVGKHGAAFRDWETLLRAYGDLPSLPPLRIIGRDDLPPAERGGVELPPGVELVPYLPVEKLAEELEKACFVVLPLPERGQSLGQLSLLLCMALGKAVVASRVIGLGDYLVDGETGLFYTPGDHRELAACLEKLTAEPETAVEMGCAARHRQQELFGDEAMGRRWEEIFFAVTGLPR